MAKCSNPDCLDPDTCAGDMDDAEFYAGIQHNIRNRGRHLLGVFGGPEDLSFTYTIGNHTRGLPELLVIGTHNGYLLNVLSDAMLERGRAFSDGELVKSANGKVTVKIINANARARDEFTIQAGRYFGSEGYAVQQVLLPDKKGRFPGNSKCQKPFSTVPILRVVQ